MLALTAQKFGTRPSRLLQLGDEVIALDFDNAAALRLQWWEDERAAAFLQAQVGGAQPEMKFEQVRM